MNIVQNTKVRRSGPASCWMVVAAVLMIVHPTITFAGDIRSDESTHASKIACGAGRSPCCCPDDYVRKPAPCIGAVPSCCPDTYCRKPCLALPCPTKCCCPDDYCPKPLPSLCQPMSNAWYKCVVSPPCNWLKPATCIHLRDRCEPRSEACSLP